MCLIVIAWQAHPQYRLIVAANRDEFHERPARVAGWWKDQPTVLAGRDLQAGGSWLAVSRSGRFAAVTNYRENQDKVIGLKSRGDLVTRFVISGATAKAYADSLESPRYAGFSLLAAAGDEMCYVSNRGDPARLLPPGVYGLSNASLDTPWQKLVRSRERLRQLLDQDLIDISDLMQLLGDRTPADAGEASDEQLPGEMPHDLSSPFIVAEAYGTRCSTVVLHRRDGTVEFVERRFHPDGTASGESRLAFAAR